VKGANGVKGVKGANGVKGGKGYVAGGVKILANISGR
jgi:hypothetical protein